MIISPSAISPYKLPTFQSGGASFVGLLDLYPNAAAAYSVRLLKSDYAGSAMEVRRSSDNALQDIGFDANGDLDTASLLSFVGAGNGFVRTWYDQSGNSVDVTQTTISIQPKIVSIGSVNILNSVTAVSFGGGSIVLTNSGFSGSSVNTILMVFNQTNLNARALTFEGLNSGLRNTASNNLTIRGTLDVTILSSFSLSGQNLIQCYGVNPVTTYYNENIGGTGNQNAYVGTLLKIGGGSSNMIGNIQEVILYNTDEVSNKSGIESNINTYFSIY
jgi:hypothetical protein